MPTSEKNKISAFKKTKENYQFKVSIIVPCYNTRPWLDECLQSLIAQTLQDIEIICINDASTDGTSDRLDQWQVKYPDKIKVIHQQNSGLSNARNAGMAIAQGECISFVDSDDFVDVTMYEKLYQVLKDKKVDIVNCDCLCFNDGEIVNNKKNNYLLIEDTNSIEEYLKTSFFTCCFLYRKCYLQEINIKFEPNIRYLEDYIFAYDIVILLPRMVKINNKFYYYRRNRLGQLTLENDKKLYDIFKAFEHIENRKTYNTIYTLSNTLDKYMLRFKIYTLWIEFKKIDKRYKLNFLFKISNAIFYNKRVLDIYKKLLIHKYRNSINNLLAFISLILLHGCYLLQKLSLRNLKKHLKFK